MTGLRTSFGIDRKRLEKLSAEYATYLDEHILPYVENGQVVKNQAGNWILKREYLFFADGIAADLFYE